MAKKKGEAAASKGKEARSEGSGLPKGAIFLALLAVVTGAVVLNLRKTGENGDDIAVEPSLVQLAATDTPSVMVRFRNAGATKKQTFDVDTNLSQAEFAQLAQAQALYASSDGARLRDWGAVVKRATASASAGNAALELLQGPPQEKASIRHFQWPAMEKGRRLKVADVPYFHKDHPIEIELLSENPRVFYVHNFMSSDEANALVEKATSPSNPYSIRPSTVGHKAWTQGEGIKNTDSTRTSENGFDVDSPTARKLKQRAWKLLRLSGGYDESLVDGFQVLRYELKQAYISHMDSFPLHTSTDHNWDPSKGGTNRFATLLVYLSDVDEGGQTVFPNVPVETPTPVPEVADKLFKSGSWEKTLVNDCYSKLSIQPKKGSALLFYSQDAKGSINRMALHGGCPVLNGTKWAANLWFWNQCRFSQCSEKHLKAGVKMTKEQIRASAR